MKAIMFKEVYSEEQIRRILNGSGIDVENEVGSDFIIFCPYHSNSRTPAGEVSKETGVFFCFGCQVTKNLLELIMHCSGRSYFEASRYIKSKETDINISTVIGKALHKSPDFIPYDELTLKRLYNQLLSSEKAKNYLAYRKISNLSIAKFSLGYSQKQDSIIIPMNAPDGMCIGFVARSIEGKEFRNTPGLPKNKILFNLHRVKSSNVVYVVESSFDAIRLDQVGFPAVATLGSNVSTLQTGLLEKYFNTVVLIADNDEAGSIMKDKLIDKLGKIVTVINIDKQYKDLGDMDNDAIKQLEFQFDNSIISMLK